jgi:hypothetical protein
MRMRVIDMDRKVGGNVYQRGSGKERPKEVRSSTAVQPELPKSE